LSSSFNPEHSKKNSTIRILAKKFQKQPENHSKLPGQMHKTMTSINKNFSVTNIFKGYKIIDLTRPNENDTMINKARNPVELGSGTTTCF
jgi:tRNA/tmRNA/rRNA uracil-C5-methylase (TrmA/RlmC/RlmD family)